MTEKSQKDQGQTEFGRMKCPLWSTKNSLTEVGEDLDLMFISPVCQKHAVRSTRFVKSAQILKYQNLREKR